MGGVVMRLGWKKKLRDLAFRAASKPLHRDSDFEVRAMRGTGHGLMIVFTSFHANVAKRGLFEFARSASDNRNRHCLFVTDLNQHWFQSPTITEQLPKIVAAYVAKHGITDAMTLGVSMGGYGAVSFAKDVNADRVLALAPQYACDPDVFPQDERWLDARQSVPLFSRPDLCTSFDETIEYVILHGRDGDADCLHWESFPQGDNIHHYLINDAKHDVIDPLRSIGGLYELVDAVWAKQFAKVTAIANRLNAALRGMGETAATMPNAWYRDHVLHLKGATHAH